MRRDPVASIVRQLGISRSTVYAHLSRDMPPHLKRPQWRRTGQVLTPYIAHLDRSWQGRGTDTHCVQLSHEIQTFVYAHSTRTVGRLITQLRRAAEAGHAPEAQGSPDTCPQGPSARTESFALVSPAAMQCADAQRIWTRSVRGMRASSGLIH
jgi:hypothetical protein